MNYHASLNRLGQINQSVKLGLESIKELLLLLDNPQNHYDIFHVAGTNGKGSTCAFIDSILGQAGIPRGKYVSPHLQCIRERISINGELIDENQFVKLENQVNDACLTMKISPSFFERVTAIALLAFKEAKVKVVVLEVGLGGRLDATNVVLPLVCGISRIDMDHTRILGSTLKQIAGEKAGIIKKNVPIMSAKQDPEAAFVIAHQARIMNAPLEEIGKDIQLDVTAEGLEVYRLGKLILPKVKSFLYGAHQYHNAALAISMVEASGLVPDLNVRRQGIKQGKWLCRYETVSAEPLVILDGGHNPAGIKALIEAIKEDTRLVNKPLILIVGMTEGHDVNNMVLAWKQADLNLHSIVVTRANVPRALPAKEVAHAFIQNGFQNVKSFLSSFEAVAEAKFIAERSKGVILGAGSLYLAGEIRSQFYQMPKDSVSPYY